MDWFWVLLLRPVKFTVILGFLLFAFVSTGLADHQRMNIRAQTLVDEAKRIAEMGKWERAEELFKQAVKADPENIEVTVAWIKTAVMVHEARAAMNLISEMLNVPLDNELGDVYLRVFLYGVSAIDPEKEPMDGFVDDAVKLDSVLTVNALLDVAYIYYVYNVPAVSITCYQKALELDDDNVFAYVGLGAVYEAIGDTRSQELLAFKMAAKLDHDNPVGQIAMVLAASPVARSNFHLRCGLQLIMQGSFTKGDSLVCLYINETETKLGQYSTQEEVDAYIAANIIRIMLAFFEKKYELGDSLLGRLEVFTGGDQQISMMAVGFYFDAGWYEKAYEKAEQFLEENPDSPAMLAIKLMALEKMDRWDEIETYIDQTALESGEEIVVLNEFRAFINDCKKWDAGYRLYSHALSRNPNSWNLAYNTMYYLCKMKQTEQAYDVALAYQTNNPDNPDTPVLIAHALLHMKKVDEAISLLIQAHEADMENDFIWGYLIGVAMESGQTEKLLPYTLKELELYPDSSRLVLRVGDCYRKLGDIEKANEYYQDAYQRFPDDPVVLNDYAYHIAEIEDVASYNSALSMVNRSLENDPDNPSVLDTKVWVLFRMGQYDQALEIMQQIESEIQEEWICLDHYAEILWAIGDYQKAMDIWEQIVQEVPYADTYIDKLDRVIPESDGK